MSAKPLSALSIQELADVLKSIDTILVDCDGVLWLGDSPLPGSASALKMLRDMGKKIFYVTNNSTKTRDEFVTKCRQLGYEATKDEILSTSYLTACYLSDIGFKGKVYIIGSKGVTQELDAVGIRHSDIGPDNLDRALGEFVQGFVRDSEIGAVVVGFDEHFNYIKMLKAVSYLKDPNCVFIGTNTDERFPMKTDLVIPGTGSIVAGVEKCAGREAFIIGKPSKYLGEAISKRYNVDPKRTLMIGDRGNTDILLGTRCGFQTLLVLTGMTSLEEVEKWQKSDDSELKSCVPEYYLQKLGDLVDLIQCKANCSVTN